MKYVFKELIVILTAVVIIFVTDIWAAVWTVAEKEIRNGTSWKVVRSTFGRLFVLH